MKNKNLSLKKGIIFFMAVVLFAATGCSLKQETVTEEPQVTETEEDTEVFSEFVEELPEETSAKKENKKDKTDKKNEKDEADNEQQNETEASEEESEDAFDYIAIGNSVTCNKVSELWWGTWGMAATRPENDYVHLVTKWLKDQTGRKVTVKVLDMKQWEVASDRNSKVERYLKYIDENTDLITIQTGENITENKEHLDKDYDYLLSQIIQKAPNAQILVLDELLWPKDDIVAGKAVACAQNGITIVDMTKYLEGYEEKYRSSLGKEVAGADGSSHAIDNEVVAAHPNDEGMAVIAEAIEEYIVVVD